MTQREKHAERVSRIRLDEARCAWEFLYHGEPHAECIFADRGEPRCSRDYDPGPPPEDEELYAGSALMTLWENTPWSADLAGWNVRGRTR